MATSRYRDDMKIVYDDETIYEVREPLNMSTDDSDEFYRVKNGDTWRDVAFALYGDARYYWLLAEFNRNIDPFIPPRPESLVRCPTMKRILEAGY